jgi:hypothetical protein
VPRLHAEDAVNAAVGEICQARERLAWSLRTAAPREPMRRVGAAECALGVTNCVRWSRMARPFGGERSHGCQHTRQTDHDGPGYVGDSVVAGLHA